MNTSYKHNVYLFRSAAFTVEFIYLFLHHVLLILHIYYMIIVRVVAPPGLWTSLPMNWSDHEVQGLRRRPFDQTVRHSLLLGAHFIADQLVGQLDARFFANQLVRLSVASSSATLGARRLSWGLHGIWIVRCFIVSHARARQLSWGLRLSIRLLAYYILPTLHVMCDIKVFHAIQIKVLILGATSGVLISISITAIQC